MYLYDYFPQSTNHVTFFWRCRCRDCCRCLNHYLPAPNTRNTSSVYSLIFSSNIVFENPSGRDRGHDDRQVQAFLFLVFIFCFCFFFSSNFSAAKTCPPPDVPENAKLVRKVTNFTIGSTVKMVCDTGFFRRGRRSRIKCLPNRQWTKSNFSCVGK